MRLPPPRRVQTRLPPPLQAEMTTTANAHKWGPNFFCFCFTTQGPRCVLGLRFFILFPCPGLETRLGLSVFFFLFALPLGLRHFSRLFSIFLLFFFCFILSLLHRAREAFLVPFSSV